MVVTPSSDPIPASCMSTPLFTAFYGAGLPYCLESFTWEFVHLSVFKIKIEMTSKKQGPRRVAREYGKDLGPMGKIPKTVGCTSAGYILAIGRQQSS